ncbi:LysR family transcriptional regulator [Jannaschia sp. LMIT008]|uniref:LysR family transcriptional regulator n=1 Tax=Jannaschia maritima TaxID=3032585 RepID=UPI002810F841|nr:LysR family transcriptional regulator [Jannaschia sp. LMIT008]
MDIQLIRTFVEVANTGSFVAASGRLFVTQSAVSLRVQRLEDALGKTLFERSKAGAVLTPAGHAFEGYALSLLKLWEEARQQVAVPDGFSRSLVIGGQYSLWPRLGFRWMDALREAMPDLALRAELGMPDRLTRFLVEGVCQTALTYMPQMRPGLTVRPVLDDELVMVASWAAPDDAHAPDVRASYVFADWGPEFQHAHAAALPDLTTGVTLSLGALGAEYLIPRRAAAYMPARAVRRHLDAGRLHLVPNAPRFPFPAWVVLRDDIDDDLRAIALERLDHVAAQAEDAQEEVLDELARISDDGDVEVMAGP